MIFTSPMDLSPLKNSIKRKTMRKNQSCQNIVTCIPRLFSGRTLKNFNSKLFLIFIIIVLKKTESTLSLGTGFFPGFNIITKKLKSLDLYLFLKTFWSSKMEQQKVPSLWSNYNNNCTFSLTKWHIFWMILMKEWIISKKCK